MKIINIRLTNFQAIDDMEITLNGHSAAIYGENATGKTTIANAVTWLLFDKPVTGAKNWSPKPRGATGEKHNIDTSVTATFELQDGSRISLGKTFREVWKKKRGAASAEYTGNTVDYYLDGVPAKEKEYTAAVARYCGGEEVMKLLTMPDYFPETLDWKKRRELLLAICGDVSDAAVIGSSPELAELPDYLRKPGTQDQFYSVEEYSKIAKARKTDINKKLEAIPGRIDEAQRAIPTGLPDADTVKARIEEASKAAQEYRDQIAAIRDGSADAARAALATAKADMAEAKALHTKQAAAAVADSYEAIAAMDKRIRELERQAEDSRADAEVNRSKAERLTKLRESILTEYREAAAVRYDPGQETCPTCGRPLPEDQIERLRADFNQRRSEHLMAINERGRSEASKAMIAQLEETAREADGRAADAAAEAAQTRREREALAGSIQKPPAFETTPEYEALARRIAAMETLAADHDRALEAQTEAVDAKLQEALKAEHVLREQLFQIAAAEKQRARVAELEAEEKRLAGEYEDTEHGIYLCEVFTRTKVAALTERINSKFRSVSFQLFTEQLSGGLAECCEVLIPSEDGAMVPYSTANDAAKVNAGLEIISTIAQHFGQEMPVIVDNAERVTHLLDTGGQVIRLVVSEADKTLRVEVAA